MEYCFYFYLVIFYIVKGYFAILGNTAFCFLRKKSHFIPFLFSMVSHYFCISPVLGKSLIGSSQIMNIDFSDWCKFNKCAWLFLSTLWVRVNTFLRCFFLSGWMKTSQLKWLILAWQGTFMIRNTIASKITNGQGYLWSGWPLKACKHRSSRPSLMWLVYFI